MKYETQNRRQTVTRLNSKDIKTLINIHLQNDFISRHKQEGVMLNPSHARAPFSRQSHGVQEKKAERPGTRATLWDCIKP